MKKDLIRMQHDGHDPQQENIGYEYRGCDAIPLVIIASIWISLILSLQE